MPSTISAAGSAGSVPSGSPRVPRWFWRIRISPTSARRELDGIDLPGTRPNPPMQRSSAPMMRLRRERARG